MGFHDVVFYGMAAPNLLSLSFSHYAMYYSIYSNVCYVCQTSLVN